MNRDEALAFIGANTHGVLATIKRDGRPQLSHVSYMLDTDGLIKMSVTQDRAKTKNARRDDRVSLSVIGPDWYQYVVAEGRAHLIDDDPVPLLRHVYRAVAGKEHPDWDDFDAAMVRDGRLVLAIEIEKIYPLR